MTPHQAKEYGLLVERARKKQNMERGELLRQASVDDKTYRNVVEGQVEHRSNPDTLERINRALAIKPEMIDGLLEHSEDRERSFQSQAKEAARACSVSAINCVRNGLAARENPHRSRKADRHNPEKIDPSDEATQEDGAATDAFVENFESFGKTVPGHILQDGFFSVSEEGGLRLHFLGKSHPKQLPSFIVGGDELDDSAGFATKLSGGAATWLYKMGEGYLASALVLAPLNLLLTRVSGFTTTVTEFPAEFFLEPANPDLDLARGVSVTPTPIRGYALDRLRAGHYAGTPERLGRIAEVEAPLYESVVKDPHGNDTKFATRKWVSHGGIVTPILVAMGHHLHYSVEAIKGFKWLMEAQAIMHVCSGIPGLGVYCLDTKQRPKFGIDLELERIVEMLAETREANKAVNRYRKRFVVACDDALAKIVVDLVHPHLKNQQEAQDTEDG